MTEKGKCGERKKGTARDPKRPTHLSNVLVVLLRLGFVWLPVELVHWHLLMILKLKEATGTMQRFTGGFCLI